jgi:tRNA (guanine37-N1)-methyltransferase
MWVASVLTLYPDMFPGPLGLSLSGRALESGVWSLETRNIRDYALDRHRSVDDTPAGGGAGMILKPDVVAAALEAAQDRHRELPCLYLSPKGVPLTQERVKALAAAGQGAHLLCGRFEGVDQRVIEAFRLEEVSIGDYIVSGGEIAAMVLIDACVRLLPGVMGSALSACQESFDDGLLEYPQYTKPPVWNGLPIPSVLLSGNHAAIEGWRRTEAENLTRVRRPDLWARYVARKDGQQKA